MNRSLQLGRPNSSAPRLPSQTLRRPPKPSKCIRAARQSIPPVAVVNKGIRAKRLLPPPSRLRKPHPVCARMPEELFLPSLSPLLLPESVIEEVEDEDEEPPFGSLVDEVDIFVEELNATKPLRLKVIYPDNEDRDRTAPCPVVIMFIGSFMENNRYQWLGERLVKECGIIYAVMDMVYSTESRQLMMPIDGGDRPSPEAHTSIIGVFEKLKELNENGALAGRMDLKKVVVGGHSAGGRVAMLDAANTDYFPNVIACFLYGAHAAAIPEDDVERGSMYPLLGTGPILLVGGNRDRILQVGGLAFGQIYKTPMQPVKQTFDEAVPDNRQCYYVELDGFNHQSIVSPDDDSLRTAAIDGEATHEKQTMLDEHFKLISLFVKEHALGDKEAAKELERYLFQGGSPYVKEALRKF